MSFQGVPSLSIMGGQCRTCPNRGRQLNSFFSLKTLCAYFLVRQLSAKNLRMELFLKAFVIGLAPFPLPVSMIEKVDAPT